MTAVGFSMLVLVFALASSARVRRAADKHSALKSTLGLAAFAGALLMLSGVALFLWRTLP